MSLADNFPTSVGCIRYRTLYTWYIVMLRYSVPLIYLGRTHVYCIRTLCDMRANARVAARVAARTTLSESSAVRGICTRRNVILRQTTLPICLAGIQWIGSRLRRWDRRAAKTQTSLLLMKSENFPVRQIEI